MGWLATRFVRWCYDVVVRTTLDISDEAYYIAKAIARDQNRSLGRVVGDLILQSSKGAKDASIKMSDYGFPTFRCARPVSTEHVQALDDEEYALPARLQCPHLTGDARSQSERGRGGVVPQGTPVCDMSHHARRAFPFPPARRCGGDGGIR